MCCGRSRPFTAYKKGMQKKCDKCKRDLTTDIEKEVDRVKKYHLAPGKHTVYVAVKCTCGKTSAFSVTIDKVIAGPKK